MKIDRRTFIATALGATAATVANFTSRSSTVQARTSLPPCLLKRELVASGMDRNCVVFKIDGWDCCDDIAIDGSKIASADLMTHDPTADHVLIKINQAWRTTWR
jgi:hypothetical protein